MQRVFLLGLAFVVTLAAALGIFLFLSLWPYFSLIGKVAAGVVIVGLVCLACLAVAFTYNKIASWTLHRRLVTFPDAGASYRERDGSWTHLSGIHQQMALPPPQVTVKELPSGDPRWDAVMDLRKTGKGMHAIAKELKVPYNRVRTFLNQVEGNDDAQ